ncbi:MAG: hypothetical protein NC187_06275 [Candidatus Amulumruptor caecigallinarius]|nr:hypothetical protein [Candidatus Amulumruptor caecigallinarius]MCM1397076.1 hypothetical protein [Candidatus Amulumruptor caecigallinarius]MCM1454062.1 hypothetical protein [bacterium]
MKKYILILIFSIISLAAAAKAPNLHVEKMFDGSYSANPSVSINISRTPQKYFRGCTVTNNSSLLNKVAKLFEKDLEGATKSQDLMANGTRYRSMVIMNNGEEIYIGLSYDANNGCYLFISGPLSAFK